MRAALAAVLCGAALWGALPAGAGVGNEAKLIDVDVIKPWNDDRGKPGGGGQANCSNAGAATQSYALTGWVVSAKTAHLNTATVPASLGSVTQAMQSSFDAWTGVPRITVATDGSATRYGANRLDEIMFGNSGSSLATTYTWRWTDGQVESDVVFNSRMAWFQASSEGDGCVETQAAYDVANIATHEFGHVYGLGHPAGARFETMYAYGFTGETLKRSPTVGDQNGIAAAAY